MSGTFSDVPHIDRVRAGDVSAFGDLFERHRPAAQNLARQLAGCPAEVDELVAEGFAKVLNIMLTGRGPDSAFRPYLLTAVRHIAYDRSKARRKEQLVGDIEQDADLLPALQVPFVDTASGKLDRALVAQAFRELPQRWREVLQYTELEGRTPAEVGPLMGLTANGVSALAFRARDGLRTGFLQAHLRQDRTGRACESVRHLGAWTRGGLPKRATLTMSEHLRKCRPCSRLAVELAEVTASCGLRGAHTRLCRTRPAR